MIYREPIKTRRKKNSNIEGCFPHYSPDVLRQLRKPHGSYSIDLPKASASKLVSNPAPIYALLTVTKMIFLKHNLDRNNIDIAGTILGV